ncbi:calcium-binding protein [Mesorhizobium sp. ASY16-5R]|uniref:calcium-binding protein n=1 Tax=Mesorhizobium sp. ASY16-5R TaxID=3445772 RepID=UPI003F9FC740
MPIVTQRVSAQSEGLSGSPYDQLTQSIVQSDNAGGDFSFQSSSGFIFGANTQTSPGVFSLSPHSIVVRGTNLGYDPFFGFYPFSGVITSLTIVRAGATFSGTYPPSGNTVFDVTGLSLNLSDSQVRNAFLDVFTDGDTSGLENLIAGLPYTFFGSSGADVFEGGNVVDDIRGAAGNDRLSGFGGNDKIYGQDGDDTLTGGVGADYLSGGTGVDTASYAGGSAVKVNLGDATQNTGDAAGDTFNSIENLIGSGSTDSLIGNTGNNVLNGASGNDALYGMDGSDTLIGGKGADKLNGGAGGDTASYAGASAGVVVSLANPAINTGDAAGDSYSSIENLTGSSHADTLEGNSGANVINGSLGNDTIKGNAGNDTLTGSSGADFFVFNTALNATTNVDKITDFNLVDDTIQLDDAIFTVLPTGALAGSAFKDVAVAAIDANDRILYNSDTGSLFYDRDGSGSAFTAIKFASLTGSPTLTAADFVVI